MADDVFYRRDRTGKFAKRGSTGKEKNITQLQADIPAIAAHLKESVGMVQKWAALQFYRYVVGANGPPSHPVKTGYSRSNWNIAIGSPNVSVTPRPERLTLGSTVPAPAPPEIADPKGQPIFVTNSVDYVQYLEEGTSTQAPHGFIMISVRKTEVDLDNLLKKDMS